MWILVRRDDGTIVGEPSEAPPPASAELEPVECPIGFPEAMTWSPAARAFFDKPRRLYTFNEFVDLFPVAEQFAIAAATMTDPMAKLFYDRAASASGSIDPADPRIAAGLGYLVGKGWVSQATVDGIVKP